MKNNFKILIIIFVCISISGCAALKEKFTRKKPPQKITPIIEIKDYSMSIKVDKLYKKHFVFWKSWEEELIQNLDKNIKKRRLSYRESLMELKTLSSFLKQQKQEELKPYIKELEKMGHQIEKHYLSKVEKHRLRIKLKKHKRIVDREFPLSKVKPWLVNEPE